VARPGRQNLRYELVATVIETLEVDPAAHERYTTSRPILKGKIPVSDEVPIDAWPCNHLAFTYGDLTAALAEFAHRLDIGFRIFDRHGREFRKPFWSGSGLNTSYLRATDWTRLVSSPTPPRSFASKASTFEKPAFRIYRKRSSRS